MVKACSSIMKKKQLLLMAAIASIALLGSSCSKAGNNNSVQSVQAQSPQQHDSHSQSKQRQEKESNSSGRNYDLHHHSKSLEVSADQPIPSVDLIVHEDEVMGWNLELQVSNFQFAPESANQGSITNEGHAYLYINGENVSRLYGPWIHLDSLEPGENELKVTLNAHGHETLHYQGKEIADTEVVQVPVGK